MEPQKLAFLKKITSFCRKNGIQKLKIEGIEIDLSPAALFPGIPGKGKKADATEQVTAPVYTDEQIALWSAGSMMEADANG